jgi:hypothetical protein
MAATDSPPFIPNPIIMAWIVDSYQKDVVARIPDWLKRQNFTMTGPIQWEGDNAPNLAFLVRETPLYGMALQWVSEKKSPTYAQRAAFWLFYYGARHVAAHYGSYELQVLLFCAVNAMSHTGEDPTFGLLGEWLKIWTDHPTYADKWMGHGLLLREAVTAVLRHHTQLLRVYEYATVFKAELRYHSFVHEWSLEQLRTTRRKIALKEEKGAFKPDSDDPAVLSKFGEQWMAALEKNPAFELNEEDADQFDKDYKLKHGDCDEEDDTAPVERSFLEKSQ